MKNSILLALQILLATSVSAQTSGYQVGQKVTNFSLSNSQNKTVNLNDYTGSKAVVVVFVNANCPNGRLYGNRLRNLASAYAAKGVTFIPISSPISMEAGGAEVKTLGNQVPTPEPDFLVLQDSDNKVSAQFGATKIPEVFVLQNTNGSFTLKYKGAIDDNPQLESSVKESYLQNALEAVLGNKSLAVTEKKAFGCRIRPY